MPKLKARAFRANDRNRPGVQIDIYDPVEKDWKISKFCYSDSPESATNLMNDLLELEDYGYVIEFWASADHKYRR